LAPQGGGLNRFQHAPPALFPGGVNEPGNSHSCTRNFVRALWKSITAPSGLVRGGRFFLRYGAIRLAKKFFISFRSQPDDPDSPVFAENVTEIIEDRDCNVWIGTPDNIYRYERARQTIEHIAFDKEPVRISALFEDRDGNIWIGSRYNGLRNTIAAHMT
jgi:hypothetical protein